MATYTSVATGNWLTDATWSGTGTPDGNDDVIVVAGHIVNVAAPGGAAKSVVVNGGKITLAGQTLAVGGDCLIRSGGSIARVANGTLTVGGDCHVQDGSALQPSVMTIAGRLTMVGSLLLGAMTLAVSGLARLVGCDVTSVDASGGNRLLAYGCKRIGTNTNVDFYLARTRRAVAMLSRRAVLTGLA